MTAPFAETAAEWRERWEEAARHGLRWRREAERREERIDRLRRAVADLRATNADLRDECDAAQQDVLGLVDRVREEQERRAWAESELADARAAARVEHPKPADGSNGDNDA